MKKEIIRLDNIKRDFQVGEETVHALRGVSFSISEGEFVTIMGTSGSGKSTLLNMLGCLDTPTSGDYYLDGVSVRKTAWPVCQCGPKQAPVAWGIPGQERAQFRCSLAVCKHRLPP